jgi:hypothetical protein
VERAHAQRVHLELADPHRGELGPPDLHLVDDEAADGEGSERQRAQGDGPGGGGAQGPHPDRGERPTAVRSVRPERAEQHAP